MKYCQLTEEDLEEVIYFLEQLRIEWDEQEVVALQRWKKKYESLDRRVEMLKRVTFQEENDCR